MGIKTLYETTDGAIFSIITEAQDHQKDLDKIIDYNDEIDEIIGNMSHIFDDYIFDFDTSELERDIAIYFYVGDNYPG